VAELLGKPLMPWQRFVADVALEVDPRSGRLAYREVDLTISRQQGKTLLTLSVMVHRALAFGGRQNIRYTAQTRNHALAKWEDEHVEMLKASPLASLFTVRRQRGQEAIKWITGSMHGITAPNEDAGHSETLDLAVIDEAWSQEDARVEQGLSPTMITRPEPQLWVPSTAGTLKSAYLRGKIDAGRERLTGTRSNKSSVAYFEWSAPPEADPADPATWWATMPALGWTVTEQTIQGEYERLDLPEFCRAYLNWWPDEMPAEDWTVIAFADWAALTDPASRIEGLRAFAADITPERSYGSIGVAGRRRDGRVHVELVDHRPGTGWMVDRLVELRRKWNPCAVVVDDKGPAGSLIAPLAAAGIEVLKPGVGGVAHASQAFYDACALENAALRHLGQSELAAALAGARRRDLGDGGWAWARKATTVDLSPLVAVTLASWGYATRAHLAGLQLFTFGGESSGAA
jgi:hypothetical protein